MSALRETWSQRRQAGEQPNIGTSTINSSKDVNVYWTLTNSGITFDNYSATFTFVAGDIDSGANTSAFIVGEYSGGWTYPSIGTRTSTSTQATGVTSLSDFAVGEETDIIAPVLATATVENAAPSDLVLTYNETLDPASVPANGDFVIGGADAAGRTVTGVAVTANKVTLTLSAALVNGKVINVSYTVGAAPIQDVAGNDAAALVNQAVTNNVALAGGGGGGEGGFVKPTLTGLVATTRLELGADGTVQATCQLKTSDGNLTLDIAKGIRLLDSLGKALKTLSVTLEPSPSPSGEAIIVAYNLGLNGATFSPAITLIIKYDPATLPEGVAEKALYIAYWDGSKWIALTTTVNAEANNASCKPSHFTTFAVLAKLTPPPPLAYFEVRNLDISPSQVRIGENVIISAQIANTGGVSGEYTLMVNVEGLLETSQVITLAPEQSQEVSFTVTRDTPGSYQVEIGGLQGSFVVVAPPPAPATEAGGFKWLTTWLTAWWLIPALVTMALAALAFILVRKRRQPTTVVEEPSGPVPTAAEEPREPVPTVAKEQPREPVPVLSPVRDLKIIPNRVKPGGTIYVFAEVTNNNPTASSFSLVLKVRGVIEAVKEINLGPGQSRKVVFIVLRDKPGVYDVDLEGLKGSFTVEE